MNNNITLFAFISLFMLTACGGGSTTTDNGTGNGTSSALTNSSVISSKSSVKSSSKSSTAASSISSVGTGQENPASSSKASSSSSSIAASSVVAPASSVAASSVIVEVSSPAAVSSSSRVVSSSSLAPSSSSSIASSVKSSSSAVSSSIASSSSVASSSVKSSSSSAVSSSSFKVEHWVFRGTPNAWGKTPMIQSGNIFTICQKFAGTSEFAFKISNDDVADWAEAYPVGISNYVVAQDFSYDITFNSTTHVITATKRTTACGTVVSSSSSSVVSVSSSSSVVSSSSIASSSVKSSSSSVISSSVASSSAGPHHSGEDCKACHVAGGSASSKIFTVAGTVYKTDGTVYVGAEVILKNIDMEIVKLITDASGNFSTNQSLSGVDISDLDPQVTGTSTLKMLTAPDSGSCNSCHKAGGRAGGHILAL